MNYINMIILLLAGLGAFMIGFKILSDNMTQLADGGLRKMFNKANPNPLLGVGIGTVSTVILQSSSATTVMIIGFVNAGVMNLFQATSVIMGANIGTTITSQIAALGTFDFIKYAMILSCIGIFVNLFSKREKVKIISYGLAGLGLLFMGLKYMSNAMVEVRDSEVITQALQTISNPFLLLFIGMAFTALVQSSSATTALIISMTSAGLIIGNGGNAILYVVLGTNIGTCITAILSAIGTTPNAKRAALIHLLFNVFGTLIFTILLLCWPRCMELTFERWFSSAPTQIAMFHTFFNTICTLIFLPFIKMFVFIVEKLIKDKPIKEVSVTQYLDERLISTPAVAVSQIEKEVESLANMSIESLEMALKGFCEKTNTTKEVMAQNKKLAEIQKEIEKYSVKVSSSETMSYANELRVAQFQHALVDINRIAELAENITRYTESTIEKGLSFSDGVVNELKDMMSEIKKLFENAMLVFLNRERDLLEQVDSIEDDIDNRKKRLIDEHIRRVNAGVCNATSSGTYINLISNLERVGDHIYLIAHSAD